MDLNSMMLPEKVVSFEYPGLEGLEFQLAYMSKDKTQELIKKATTSKFNPKLKTTVDSLDDDKFLELYIGSVVRGWTGFKVKYLPEFVLVDMTGVSEEDNFEYTPENALTLVKNSASLDDWIAEKIND